MALQLPFGVDVLNPLPADYKYGPYASVATAKAAIPLALRYDGLTVQITGSGNYWWEQSDLTDTGLKLKQVGTFTGLSDTPSSYVSQALKSVRVNAGETALEFYDAVTPTLYKKELFTGNGVTSAFTVVGGTIDQLAEVYINGIEQDETLDFTLAGNTVTFPAPLISGANLTIKYFESLSVGSSVTAFTDLTDVPSSYTGQTLKAVRVNAGETGLEFYTPGASGWGTPTDPSGSLIGSWTIVGNYYDVTFGGSGSSTIGQFNLGTTGFGVHIGSEATDSSGRTVMHMTRASGFYLESLESNGWHKLTIDPTVGIYELDYHNSGGGFRSKITMDDSGLKLSINADLGTSGYVLTSDGTNATWQPSSGGGGGTWGSITGTLSDQTDLQAALDAKQDDITFGTDVLTAVGVNVGSAGSILLNGTGATGQVAVYTSSTTVGGVTQLSNVNMPHIGRTITSGTTIIQDDDWGVIIVNSGTNINITVNSLTINSRVELINKGVGDVTFLNGSGVTFTGSSTMLSGETAVIIFESATAPLITTGSGTGGVGTIGGSIAADQVALGLTTDEVYGSSDFTFTNRKLFTKGTASSSTLFPSYRIGFSADADAALSLHALTHSSQYLTFASYYNGTNYTSSSPGANFAIFNSGAALHLGYGYGVSKGSTFSGFGYTGSGGGGGLSMGINGTIGVGTAPPTVNSTRMEIGAAASYPSLRVRTLHLQSIDFNSSFVTDGLYYDGSGFKRTDTGYGSYMWFFQGGVNFATAGATSLPAGTTPTMIGQFSGLNDGRFRVQSLDTDLTAPTTTGALKMVVSDNTGILSNVPVIRILSTNITTTGNVGTGEDVIFTYTVPAAQLLTDKDRITASFSGRIAGSANTKTIKIKFGSTTLFSTGAVADASGSDWTCDVEIWRTGAATQKAIVKWHSNNTAVTQQCDYTTPAETLSGTVVLSVTGEATADNEVLFDMGEVVFKGHE